MTSTKTVPVIQAPLVALAGKARRRVAIEGLVKRRMDIAAREANILEHVLVHAIQIHDGLAVAARNEQAANAAGTSGREGNKGDGQRENRAHGVAFYDRVLEWRF